MSEEKLTLGQYFRMEREKKGIDLKEIEEKTKISAQTLRFLEEDQIDMLPPRAFLRGFLQVISNEFDFDEEELVKHLDETLASFSHPEEAARRFRPQDKSSLSKMIIVFVVILVAVVIFGIFMKTCTSPKSPESPQSSVDAYAASTEEKACNVLIIDTYPS